MATEKRLIDANAFIEHFERAKKIAKGLFPAEMEDTLFHLYDDVIEEIKKQPTVDAVEVVHGRWIEKQEPIPWCEDDVDVYTVCSVCDSYSPGESNYCPNCGAKMDGDGNG